MAKKFKKIARKGLVMALVLVMAVSMISLNAFAAWWPGWGGGYGGGQDDDKYEWYQIYVQGQLVDSDQGRAGDVYWLGQSYDASYSIEGTELKWVIAPDGNIRDSYTGTVDLTPYIGEIPEGYEINEVVLADISGVNDAVFDQYDNAIITITIKSLVNEEGDIIELPEPPPVDPSEPPVDPSEPPVDPSEPPVDPSEPPVDPSEPPVDPSEPPVDPSEPPVDPSEPPVNPSEPPVEPTDPPAPPYPPYLPPVGPQFPPTDEVEEEEEHPVDPQDDPGEVIDIPDDEVPLTDIPDEEVPKTGDPTLVWAAALVASGVGLTGLAIRRKKEDEE